MNQLVIEPKKEVAQITPDSMIMAAIEKGLDLNQLEKFLDLRERWEKREAEKAFNQAMANFQENKPEIVKSKKGHNSNYAPLPKVQKAIDPVAAKFGLSYRFEQKMEGDKMVVTCIVTHKDGHSERCTMEGPADTSGSKNAIQSWGSTRTYLYRYTLEGAFGISSDDDDDGQKSQLTKEEIQELQKDKIVELQAEKAPKIDAKLNARIDHIVKTNEVASYGKVIETLKKL